MREIKFKFWLGHTKKMTYEHTLIEISNAHWDFTEDIIPLQFTGLKDKNGKEIYESDIVRILYTDWLSKDSNDTRTIEQYMNDIAFIGSVVFYRDCFCIESKSNKYGDVGHSSIFPGEHGFIEIIGNIYESPELLNPLNKQS